MSNMPHSPLCMCQVCQDEALASEMRKDAETLRAVTAERDALQARIAQLEKSAIGGYEDGWHALRNERDALKAENAQLRDVLADRDMMDRGMAARSKLQLIEANRQLEALRARIEDAPCATVFLGACGDLSITTAELNDAIVGKCVRLVIDNE